MSQLKRELKNMKKLKLIIFLFAFVFIPNLVMTSISDNVSLDSWESSARETRATYSGFLDGSSGEEDKFFEEQLQIIDYSLDNNIPYKAKNCLIHVLDMSFLTVIIMIIIIFSTNESYCREYRLYSWDELIEGDNDKKKVFLKKYLFSIIKALFCLIFMLGICVICGLITYGWGGNFSVVKLVNGNIEVVNIVDNIVKYCILLLSKSIFYVSITVMISIIFKDKKIGLSIPILLAVLGTSDLLSVKWFNVKSLACYSDLLKGVIILLFISVIFYFIALNKFQKEDNF